jgi:hypothetical protein
MRHVAFPVSQVRGGVEWGVWSNDILAFWDLERRVVARSNNQRPHEPETAGKEAPETVSVPELGIQKSDQIADFAMSSQRMPEMNLGLNFISIAASFLDHCDETSGGQVINDTLYRAFGNAHFCSDFAHTEFGVLGDQY